MFFGDMCREPVHGNLAPAKPAQSLTGRDLNLHVLFSLAGIGVHVKGHDALISDSTSSFS
jgi:hypothetical protein